MFAVLDPLLIPLVVGALMVLCAAVVCVVAIVRADRRDVVEVVRASRVGGGDDPVAMPSEVRPAASRSVR